MRVMEKVWHDVDWFESMVCNQIEPFRTGWEPWRLWKEGKGKEQMQSAAYWKKTTFWLFGRLPPPPFTDALLLPQKSYTQFLRAAGSNAASSIEHRLRQSWSFTFTTFRPSPTFCCLPHLLPLPSRILHLANLCRLSQGAATAWRIYGCHTNGRPLTTDWRQIIE